MRRTFSTFLSVLTIVVVAAAPISPKVTLAQSTEEEILGMIAYARQNGAPISDQEVGTILRNFREEQNRLSRMQEELGWQEALPVYSLSAPASRVMGRDGIPFPKPEEVLFKPPPAGTPSPLETPAPRPVWSPEPYIRPTKCERNETRRQETNSEGDDSTTLLDKLFISEDLVPPDPQEVFGAETSLIPYGTKEEKATLIRMEIYQVPCVPYRMRMTERADYIDTGLNALKNYDSDPSGKGVLNPFVERKLYPEKQPKPRREKRGPKRH